MRDTEGRLNGKLGLIAFIQHEFISDLACIQDIPSQSL